MYKPLVFYKLQFKQSDMILIVSLEVFYVVKLPLKVNLFLHNESPLIVFILVANMMSECKDQRKE